MPASGEFLPTTPVCVISLENTPSGTLENQKIRVESVSKTVGAATVFSVVAQIEVVQYAIKIS